MSKHPVTPMNESDLRLHLARQSERDIELVDIFRLEGAYGPLDAYLTKQQDLGSILLFDTLTDQHLLTIGQVLTQWQHAHHATQLLVGSSGITYALIKHWRREKRILHPNHIEPPGTATKMLIISGSCSPVTDQQITYFEQQGHIGICMNTIHLVQEEQRAAEIQRTIASAHQVLDQGLVPIIFTARGPEDPILHETQQLVQQQKPGQVSLAKQLGSAQAQVVKALLQKWAEVRLVVAGGDTSGYVATALGIVALEMLYPMAPGAPLCIAHADQPAFDGLEICLKGGQNGNQKFFESIRQGQLLT